MTSSLALASLALLAAAPPPSGRSAAGEPPVAALVRRCVAAYGGEAALARAARVRQEGTIASLVLGGGEKGRMARAYERPGRLRVELAYPSGRGEVRVLDGGRGWRDGEEVRGPRLAAMILQAARLDLVALLAAPGAKVVDAGTLELAGRTLRVLSLSPAPGLVVEAAVDPASGRILRARGASTGPGTPVEFVTTYSEFREVAGVLVATREETWANGRATGEAALEAVEFPDRLPGELFRP